MVCHPVLKVTDMFIIRHCEPAMFVSTSMGNPKVLHEPAYRSSRNQNIPRQGKSGRISRAAYIPAYYHPDIVSTLHTHLSQKRCQFAGEHAILGLYSVTLTTLHRPAGSVQTEVE